VGGGSQAVREGGRRWWCGFNTLISAREGRGGVGMKCCRKIKQMQRAHLGSIERKRDTTRRCGDIGQRSGGTREGNGRRRRQLG
jgi:hypothetical protein